MHCRLPQFALAVVLRCRVYLLLDRVEQAYQDYLLAMQLEPSLALLQRIHSHLLRRSAALFHEATALLLSGENERAVELLCTSILIEPSDARRYTLRAQAYRCLERFELALEDLKEASLRTPAHERADIIKQTALTFNDIAMKHQSLGNHGTS